MAVWKSPATSGVFAPLAWSLPGIIQQHDLRSLLRLLGRSLSEDDVRALIRGLDPLNDEMLGQQPKLGLWKMVDTHTEVHQMKDFGMV